MSRLSIKSSHAETHHTELVPPPISTTATCLHTAWLLFRSEQLSHGRELHLSLIIAPWILAQHDMADGMFDSADHLD